MYVVKAAKTTLVQKICTFNVDEIDTRRRGLVLFLDQAATNQNVNTHKIKLEFDV